MLSEGIQTQDLFSSLPALKIKKPDQQQKLAFLFLENFYSGSAPIPISSMEVNSAKMTKPSRLPIPTTFKIPSKKTVQLKTKVIEQKNAVLERKRKENL